jgi:hypothetical protein
MHYKWLKNDPAYPELFLEHKAMAIDAWEEEAITRAIDGFLRAHDVQGRVRVPGRDRAGARADQNRQA